MKANPCRLLLLCALAGAPLAHAQDAASLRARHAALEEVLASNQFQRPLFLESAENAGDLSGDVYARIAQPYRVVGPALQGMDRWCDILILHVNVKGCRAITAGTRETLSLHVGRKVDQPLADTYRFEFLYKVVVQPDYLQVVMTAAEGPLGTRNYRILLEVAELDAGGSFVHMSYSYVHGAASRWATQLYLATLGRSKVGFSVVGHTAGGRPIYVGSTRGVLERNVMRCYLAIEAYLGALSVPEPERLDKRLNDWHDGVERYPVQLREVSRRRYLDMKRREVRRQQVRAPVTAAAEGTS